MFGNKYFQQTFTKECVSNQNTHSFCFIYMLNVADAGYGTHNWQPFMSEVLYLPQTFIDY